MSVACLPPNTATAAEDRLLTLPDVAARLALSLSSVRRLVDNGDLKSLVVGDRSRRIRASELSRYVDARSAN